MNKEKLVSYLIPFISVVLIILILNVISAIVADMESTYYVSLFNLKIFSLYAGIGILIGFNSFWKKINLKVNLKLQGPTIGILIISFVIGTSFIFDIDFIIDIMTTLQIDYTQTTYIFQIIFGYTTLRLFSL